MIKGVIFDLDGVLVSTDELHYAAWSQLAKMIGITEFNREDNQRQKGVSRMESLEIVLEKGEKCYSDAEKVLLANMKNDIYVNLLTDLDQEAVLPGAVEILMRLKKLEIKIGIGSVSKNTPIILEKTGLITYIDEVSCGLDITNSKPDPEVFLVAANKLGLQPKECLVIEDSKAGIIAARAAEMRSLAVGPEHKKLDADYCSESLSNELDWNLLLG
ncbi:beta-phosphoglucomutase [Lachnoclostridium phytofermentans]|uniref:Beta-phosphoglucomutase n=1 Tax=Lachnoclostridium phytofermentans (strain ATCC 700394 / DSM 18823 / ISDg) TaxID=357809 RepID=A9KT33_LACP7|nr:beta-phosphoglucomutase [Lachnoclostridium phytofermentans]ABX42244.1 beta-phosphoglucomutase [Lachnoclostridium phytofermentans ISDg]